MCGRFTVTTKDTKSIADRFQVELEKTLAAKESAKDASKGSEAKENGGEKKENGPPASAASTSPRPRRSSSSATTPTKRRPPRASARRG